MVVKRINNDELYHHGVKGQRWGVRRYQNKDGSLTSEGKKKYGSVENFNKRKDNMLKALTAAQVANVGINTYLFSKANKRMKNAQLGAFMSRRNSPARSAAYSAEEARYRSDKIRYGILASTAAISLGMAVGKKIYDYNKNKKLTDNDINKNVYKGKDIVKKRRNIIVKTTDGDTFTVTNAEPETYEKYKKDSRIKSVSYK